MTAHGFRLGPEDERPHVPDAAASYNESVYANAFDAQTGAGGWMRLGNRVHEGNAEVSVCLYLPDGRLAVQFQKPAITTNERFDAGGLSFEVGEPLRVVTMRYEGEVHLLEDAATLKDPRVAFGKAPKVPARVTWTMTSISPAHGGEPLTEDQPTAYGRDFSRGHFNFHTRVEGEIVIGSEHFPVQGHGWRDHSWGPRYWSNLFAHRLLTANFGDHAGLMLHKVEDKDGSVRRLGTVLLDGKYEEVEDLELTIEWSAELEPTGARVAFRTAKRRELVTVRVRSLAPLRNRRTQGTEVLESRILEAAADFRWGAREGRGMFELVENIRQGLPVGYPL